MRDAHVGEQPRRIELFHTRIEVDGVETALGSDVEIGADRVGFDSLVAGNEDAATFRQCARSERDVTDQHDPCRPATHPSTSYDAGGLRVRRLGGRMTV